MKYTEKEAKVLESAGEVKIIHTAKKVDVKINEKHPAYKSGGKNVVSVPEHMVKHLEKKGYLAKSKP